MILEILMNCKSFVLTKVGNLEIIYFQQKCNLNIQFSFHLFLVIKHFADVST
jgi:hypothetical protein